MDRRDQLPTISIGARRSEPRAFTDFAPGELLEQFLTILTGRDSAARGSLHRIVEALILEGRRFAETEDGAQWMDVLQESQIVTNGRLLWNLANVDGLLRSKEPASAEGQPLLQAGLSELASADATQLLLRLSELSLEIDISEFAKEVEA